MEPVELLEKYPAIEDMRQLAKRRMPHFAWEYLESGTGFEIAVDNNRKALDRIQFLPRVLKPNDGLDITCELLGQKFDHPFGVAPVGMTGLLWPGAELMLAASARSKNIPYCLSAVACETPEEIGEIAGSNAWFQLYTFKDRQINLDLIHRAKEAGFSTLIITADVPAPSMRERQRRAGLRVPPKLTPKFIADLIQHPSWAMATARHGKPAFRSLERYVEQSKMQNISQFASDQRMGANINWEDLKSFRDVWNGPIVLKGIMSTQDAKMAVKIGMDAIVVSNHGGRQFDASPAPISVLPEIVEAVKGKAAVIFDSGVRTGLDIMRAIALGADFVLIGRPFIYGAAAMGKTGGDHIIDILAGDLHANMMQVGAGDISELKMLDTYL